MPRLSDPLQERHALHRFERLNPDVDPSEIDFKAVIGGKESYRENIESFKEEYPQHRWNEGPSPDEYGDIMASQAREELDSWGYDVIKKRRIGQLLRKEKELDITLGKLRRQEKELNTLLTIKINKAAKKALPSLSIKKVIKVARPAKKKKAKKVIKKAPKRQRTAKKQGPKKKKPTVYKGERGGKYYLKRIKGSTKMKRVYI